MKKLLGILVLNLFCINAVYAQVSLLCTDNDDLTKTYKVFINVNGQWCWEGITNKDCRYISDTKATLFLGYVNEEYKFKEYIHINRYTGEYQHTFYTIEFNAKNLKWVEKTQDYRYGKCRGGEKLF